MEEEEEELLLARPPGAEAARKSFGDPAGEEELEDAGDTDRDEGAELEVAAMAAAAAAIDASDSFFEAVSKIFATSRRMEDSAALSVSGPSLKQKSRSP